MALALVIMSILICDISYDMYAPSLPQISQFFSVNQTTVQLTVSLNLLGGAVAGLFYGPLSDRYGRRPLMLVGITTFVCASIGCCFANTITALILMRLIQGLGAGVAAVVGYAVINDLYSGEECSRNLSLVNMVVSLTPVMGPIIGSYLLSNGYGWRFICILVGLFSVVLLFSLVFGLKETIQAKRTEYTCASVISGYISLLHNRKFMCFALIQSLTIMWIWASLTNLPFIFMEGMHFPVKYYGYVIAVSILSYIVGTMVNRRLVGRLGMYKMIVIGLALAIVPDTIILAIHRFVTLTPWMIECIWIPSSFGIAFITSNSMACAFGEVSDKGTASAFIVFSQTIFGAYGIYIVAKFYDGTIIPVAVLPVICCILAMFFMYYVLKHEQRDS